MKKENIYINEIIRITYKCNWSCKFCNVNKVNNYGEFDIKKEKVIFDILSLTKKYSKLELSYLHLAFSGGEPTLNNNLLSYIKLAKKIGIGFVELQTNGTKLFLEHNFTDKLISAGLDNIFLASHSSNIDINKNLGVYYSLNDFYSWFSYFKKNSLETKIDLALNIVITKINLFYIREFIKNLLEKGILDLLPIREENNRKLNVLNIGFVQPNGNAEKNSEEILLEYDNEQLKEIQKIIRLCENNNIFPDFHFTAPPLCILNYPNYNLEFQRLKKLEADKEKGSINKTNLETYKNLWKEKQKFEKCNECKYNRHCLGFYKNWIKFVGEDFVSTKINIFLDELYNNFDIKNKIEYFELKLKKKINGRKKINIFVSRNKKLLLFYNDIIITIYFLEDIKNIYNNYCSYRESFNTAKVLDFGKIDDIFVYLITHRLPNNVLNMNAQDVIENYLVITNRSRKNICKLFNKNITILGINNIFIDDKIKTLYDFLLTFLIQLKIKYPNAREEINNILNFLYSNKVKSLKLEKFIYLIHGDLNLSNIIIFNRKIYHIDLNTICYFDYYYDLVIIFYDLAKLYNNYEVVKQLYLYNKDIILLYNYFYLLIKYTIFLEKVDFFCNKFNLDESRFILNKKIYILIKYII